MKNKGFTLIELLVVIVIIGILATVSTATFTGSLEDARKAKSIAFFQQVVRKMNASPEALKLSYDFEDDTNSSLAGDGSGNKNDLDLDTNSTYSEDTYDRSLSTKSLSLSRFAQSIASFDRSVIVEQDFTVAFWVKTTGVTDSSSFSSGGFLAGAGVVLLKSTENQSLTFNRNGLGPQFWNLDSEIRIDDEEWHSVVFTKKDKVATFFVDGEVVYSYLFTDQEYADYPVTDMTNFQLSGGGFSVDTVLFDNVYFWTEGFSLND